MRWKELARRILYLGRRSRLEDELAVEIQIRRTSVLCEVLIGGAWIPTPCK